MWLDNLDEKQTIIETMDRSMADKTVTILLASGGAVTGKIKKVYPDFVYMTRLAGEEGFDAMIDRKQIVGIKMFLRTYESGEWKLRKEWEAPSGPK